MILVKLLLLMLALAGSGLAQGDAPCLSASVWKPEVVECEPILVRVGLANEGAEPVSLIPPYVTTAPRKGFALRLLVERRDEAGSWFAVEAPPLAARAKPWWWEAGGAAGCPPWSLEPGANSFIWLDVTDFMKPLRPGTYRIGVDYDALPEMAQRWGHPEDPVPPDLWTGHLTAEAGILTVRAPEGDDADAAAVLRDARQSMAERRDYVESRQRILDRWPTSTYAPYARFYTLWSWALQAWRGPSGFGSPTIDAPRECAAFRADYPDFPLNYQLPVIEAYAVRNVNVGPAPQYAEEWLRRYSAVVDAARATGDLGLLQWAQLELDRAREEVRRQAEPAPTDDLPR